MCYVPRFGAENPQVELLEVPGEPRGESGPLLANRRARGQRSPRGHGLGARNHPEETGGAMMVRRDSGRAPVRVCPFLLKETTEL